MQGINIVHADGKWVRNPHDFPFNDPETGVCFKPGETYKVKFEAKGSWIAGQLAAGVLKHADDPLKTAGMPAAPATPGTPNPVTVT